MAFPLVPDLRKRQHTRIAIMLQGALADVQQPAHISVVQPVRVLTLLSECLVTAFRKAQDFIPKLCSIGFRNDIIIHNHILLLFVISNFSCFHRQRQWRACTSQSSGEQQGSVGKNKEKGNPFHRFAFAFSCPVFFFRCKINIGYFSFYRFHSSGSLWRYDKDKRDRLMFLPLHK